MGEHWQRRVREYRDRLKALDAHPRGAHRGRFAADEILQVDLAKLNIAD